MSRIRSTVTGAFDTENIRYLKTRSSCAGAWSSSPAYTTYTGVVTTKTIEDIITPGFQSLQRCGGFLPLNPVTIQTVTETRTAGNGDESFNFSGGCYRSMQTGPYWTLFSWLVTLPPFDEDIVDTVVTEAVANARESIFDALTTAAEMKQTVQLLRGSWLGILQFARKAAKWARDKAKKFKRKKNYWKVVLDFFSQKWLEYRYGWLPFIYSAEDAIRALQQKMEKDDILSGKSRVVTELSDSETLDTYYPTAGTLTKTHTLIGERIYRGAAFASISSPEIAKFGLDPLVTAWELIPFSFVADWFIQVGTWIKAWSPFGGSSLLGSMASVKDTYTLEQVDSWAFNAPGHTGSFTGRGTKLEVTAYTRFAHGAGILPSWNPRITSVRFMDLVALVYQGRRGILQILH